MRRLTRLSLLLLALAAPLSVAATGCALDDKGEESELPEDSKDDTHRKPTDHGTLPFATPTIAELTDDERFHAWDFTLTAAADIDAFTTYAVRGQRRVDTVLYLYREGPTGWGPYIARNDDDGDRVYSRLKRTLEAGRYRVLVKGYTGTTRGRFAIQVDCAGDGCVATDPNACLFGTTYREAWEQPHLVAQETVKLTAASAPTFAAFDADRIVRAVQQSSHTDVTTWQEALDRVDQGEINRTFFIDADGRRTFVAYEYGAGDNSYGAFFDHASNALVAPIHDGDLYECKVSPDTCALPESYQALRADPAFDHGDDRYVTNAAEFTEHEAAQVVRAVQLTRPEVRTAAEALALVDAGSLRLTWFWHQPTNSEFTAVEFGAGDNSYGRLFFASSTQVAADIRDGFIEGCALMLPQGGGRAAAGEACRDASDCVSGLRCEGIFANAGACISTANLAGEGNECAADADCGSADLVCAGATRGGGLCNPAWMRGTFVSAPAQALRDAGVTSATLVVRGLATVDTDVVLAATLDHPRASQLRITLTNPAGATQLVYDGRTADDGRPLVLNQAVGFSGDEQVNGEWRLDVTDRTAGSSGTLADWQLTVTSRWD